MEDQLAESYRDKSTIMLAKDTIPADVNVWCAFMEERILLERVTLHLGPIYEAGQ